MTDTVLYFFDKMLRGWIPMGIVDTRYYLPESVMLAWEAFMALGDD